MHHTAEEGGGRREVTVCGAVAMDGSPLRSFEGRKHPAALPMSDNGRASEVCLGGECASVLVRRRTKTRPPPPPPHHAAAKRSWRRWRDTRRARTTRRSPPLNGRETDSIADSLEVTLDIAPRSWFLLSLPSLLATLMAGHGRSFGKTRLTQPSPFHAAREDIHLPLCRRCVGAHRR